MSTTSNELPLHDIVTQTTAGWWPLAWGWWLLIVALFSLAIVATILLVRYLKRRRGMRAVNQLLTSPPASISEVSLRLKQVLMLKHSRTSIAQLSSNQWSALLLSHLPDSQRALLGEQLTPLIEAQYQPQNPALVEAYHAWSLKWWQLAQPQFKREVANV
ncbi:DUF4381 domain-containing protein [Aliidiomarina maris]|uniref:Uncharacterized protein DUF4381 n=1 Tax=Aliidiomarina maris TaxID=531312 RepID=A0A327WXI9_9GAMM|nr:DUF4381 domain-containing protein [Aliidiomarina maris]RAJ96869.1 uncharacterized protein DUF4381 [Aliidiomarina maris]RUO24192.1 hypothetical protein CWE07_08885 [Aliidiomarina maris]